LPATFDAVLVDSSAPGLELLPEEENVLSASVVPKRRADFTAGRVAARRALALAGLTRPPALMVGPRGQPLWPAGWVGSIAHTLDVAVAVVARSTEVEAVGVDVEAREAPGPEVARHIATAQELDWLQLGLPGWRTRLGLLFSAKESLYKALFPSLGLDLDFLDVELTWDGRRRAFQPRIMAGQMTSSGWIPPVVRAELLGALIVTATWSPKR
jgi:4'-phosphopantetheinyl transferase EntD